jgi:hypothetical protein
MASTRHALLFLSTAERLDCWQLSSIVVVNVLFRATSELRESLADSRGARRGLRVGAGVEDRGRADGDEDRHLLPKASRFTFR